MAGSLDHVLRGWSLIENMGDAHEAVEQLMWLILTLTSEDSARRIVDEGYYPILRGEKSEDMAYVVVKNLMSN